MRRYHDVGGQSAGRVEKTTHEFEPWEKLVTALLSAARARGIGNLDQMRRLVEDLPPEVQDRGYTQCRAEALRRILEEHGAIIHDEVETRMAAIRERLTKSKEAKTRET